MIKAILFDMDGLMFDTERIALEGWMEAGRRLGFAITAEFVSRLRGTNSADARVICREYFGSGFDYDRVRSMRNDYAEQVIETQGIPVKKGLYQLLAEIKKRDIPIALATATSKRQALKNLERANVKQYFAVAVFGDEVVHAKPDPEIFAAAAAKLQTDPAGCLVLEDSPNGIRAAHTAGCVPVMIPDLEQPDNEIRALCAHVLPSLHDVIPLLDGASF